MVHQVSHFIFYRKRKNNRNTNKYITAVFSGKYNYSTLTEVEKVDCPLKAFKAFLCCKALLPKVVRELAKNDTMFQSGMIINQLDTCDEYTGCYEQCAGCIDFTCITCIFCGKL